MTQWKIGSPWRSVPNGPVEELAKVAERNRIKRRAHVALKMRHKRPVKKLR